MSIVLDYVNEKILITSPDVIALGQNVHDFVQNEAVTPVGLLYPYINQSDPNTDTEILYPDGKIEDTNNPGIFSQIILRLNPRWQIQFWGGSGVTTWRGAKLVGGLGGIPFKATDTAGDITIVETPVDGVTVEVSTTPVNGVTLDTKSKELLDIIVRKVQH